MKKKRSMKEILSRNMKEIRRNIGKALGHKKGHGRIPSFTPCIGSGGRNMKEI